MATLVCIHGIEGDPKSLLFKSLAARLKGQVALYAVRLTAAAREACATLEDLATRYVDLVTHRLGSGHCNILGHSFGAMIAHSMAEVLERRGRSCTLLLGDFEVAYPPRHFMKSYDAETFSDRVKMGQWEGPELEAYKLVVRRHMYSHKEDIPYCAQLLRTPGPSEAVQAREDQLRGFVLTRARPGEFPMSAYLELLEEFSMNMAFSERIVMNSTRPVQGCVGGAERNDGGFFDQHVYTPSKVATKATLFLSDSPEFGSAAEVNAHFYENLEVVRIPGNEHYNLMENARVLPAAVLERVSHAACINGAVLAVPAQESLPVCITFPGQGSQMVGMLKELKELESVQEMLEIARKVLGYDLLEVCLHGPEEKLADTKYCQPAMFVAGLAALEKLRIDSPEKVLRCKAFAGLSLGEYTALAAAGVFDFETGLRLVKARAEAMTHEANNSGAPQAMASVAGVDKVDLESMCKSCAGADQVCQIATFIFPKGFCVAGNKAAVDELSGKAIAAGALQAKVLKASGAFHTPLMQGARATLLEALASAEEHMRPPSRSVYMNATAEPIGQHTSVREIIDLLGKQLVSPVLWDASMTRIIEDGCVEFYECGPNKQLASAMKRINPGIHKQMTNVMA